MATRKVKVYVCVEPSGSIEGHGYGPQSYSTSCYVVFKTKDWANHCGRGDAVPATLTFNDGHKKRAPKRARKAGK